jgi:hypothetical protein
MLTGVKNLYLANVNMFLSLDITLPFESKQLRVLNSKLISRAMDKSTCIQEKPLPNLCRDNGYSDRYFRYFPQLLYANASTVL